MADGKTRLDASLCHERLVKAGFTPGTAAWIKEAKRRFKPSGDGETYFDKGAATTPSTVGKQDTSRG